MNQLIPSATDVAAYIVRRVDNGAVAQLKLHKLVYYAQAASLAATGRPLFNDPIEAWANGPVIPSIWAMNRYRGVITPSHLNSSGSLDPASASWVDVIIDSYGRYSGATLSEMSHNEQPWLSARAGLQPGDFGSRQISQQDMAKYYRHAWGWA